MKRFIMALFFAAVAVSAVFAGIGDWAVWDMVSLEIAPQVPLYREILADPYGFTTKFDVVKNLSASENTLNNVYSIVLDYTDAANPTAQYQELPFRSADDMAGEDSYRYLKAGTTASLFRLTFDGYGWIPKTEVEFTIGGYLDALFEGFEYNTGLGYDGSYIVGGSIRFADMVTFRSGIKHMSGHYSDEILEEFYEYNGINGSSTAHVTNFHEGRPMESECIGLQIGSSNRYFNDVVEYVRDNSFIGGVSVDLPFGFRFYAEAELPKARSWIRCAAHVPALPNPWSGLFGDNLIERIGGWAGNGEGLPQDTLENEYAIKEGQPYRGWRIHTGAEYRYSFKYVSVIASGDVQLHQDGQTMHQLGSYSRTNPWEVEYTLALGVELADALVAGKTVKLECQYHDGRAPLAQFFFERMSYFSFGISIQ